MNRRKAMKKFLVLLLVGLSLSAQAQHYHGDHFHRGAYYNWAAPAIIGGAIGYSMAQRPTTVVVQQPPVYVQQQPVYVDRPGIPYGYHYENVLDANCGCYRVVLVPN